MQISEYQENFYNKTINLKKIILIISIFIFVILSILVANNSFYDYFNGMLIIESDKKISTLVIINDLEKILNNNKIIINNVNYAYSIEKIDDDNFINGDDVFKKVYLKINDSEIFNVENIYLNYSIIIKKNTIFNYIKESIIGGSNDWVISWKSKKN